MIVLGIIAIILGTILGIIVFPFIGFFMGWGIGWVLNLIMGTWIIDGLQLFHLTVTPNLVPLFFAIIGLIASFFGMFAIGSRLSDKKE